MEQAIRNLIKSNGTPFYLFDEKGFIDNYRKLEFILITNFLIPTRPIILLLFANWLDRWVGMPR
jgi:hypothetical protein